MKRIILVAAVLIAIVGVAGGYGYYQSVYMPEEAKRAEQEKWMKTLIIGTTQRMESTDLFIGISGWDAVKEVLLAKAFWYADSQKAGVYYAGLADSWEFKMIGNNATLDVHLKEGMKFQDGFPVNTSCVLWTWAHYPAQRRSTHALTYYSVEAIDDYNLRVWLKAGSYGPAIMEYLSGTMGWIASPSTYVNGSKAVGAGAWEVEEYIPDDKLVLKAHPEYPWGPKYLDKLIVKFYKDPASLRIAVEKKEVDAAMWQLAYTDLADLAKNPKIVIEIQPSGYSRCVFPNQNVAPWNNTKVRQALAYLIETEPIIRNAYSGYAIHGNSWVSEALPYSSNIFDQIYRNVSRTERVAKARALLTEAGYPNGFKSEIWYSSRAASKETEEAVCLIIKNQAAEAGIDLELKFAEWAAYLDLMNKRTSMPLQLGLWAYKYADPDYHLQSFISVEGWWGKFMGVNNSHVEELLVQGRELYDSEIPAEQNTARKAVYFELQEILAEDALLIPVVHQIGYFVRQDYLKPGPQGAFCPWYSDYLDFQNATKVLPPD